MPRPPLLVFGLTGQIGAALLRQGLPLPALAVSRSAPEAADGQGAEPAGADVDDDRPPAAVAWRRGDLAAFDSPHAHEAALSLGPLDAFAAAVAEGRVRASRIVAFGSTSVHAKADSPDPQERDLARRLADAEAALREACARRGAACTVLRPTLIWGLGRDASVSRVVRMARRWPVLPLPLDAPGLRQPVHVDDLATAARAALALDGRFAALDLPGGERVAFGTMLGRAVSAGAPRCRVLPLPWRLARWAGGRGLPRGLAARLDADLCFDDAPARALLGWSPRGFSPTAADFPA